MRLPKFLSCPIFAREVPQVHARGPEIENNCGNQVVENEGKKKKRKKKKILRPQHFYNKLQVVSCYWFKFEPNTKITFLSQ